ncbi:MAG: DUF973 family protein [Crenarchaeota archaeon]|nr:DUF973 family protein [Thermoproteota archaeon]
MISSSQFGLRHDLFIEGMLKLKEAALLMIIGDLLVSFGSVLLFPMTLRGFHALTIGLMPGALIIVGFILVLVALYMHVVPSFEMLRDYKPEEYGTAATLVRIGYVWGAILIILGILTLIILIGVVLLLIGLILVLLGEIGLIIGMFKINEETGESMFMVAGILFIIGLFVPFLSFISWVLIYVAIDTAIARYKGKIGPASTQTGESSEYI